MNGILQTVLGWGYFIFVNNKYTVEAFDRMVFIGVTVIVILLNKIIITIRYLTISIFKDNGYNNSLFKENCNLLRYIVISEENVFVRKNLEGSYDTPYIISAKFEPAVSCEDAQAIFNRCYGEISAEFRPMYESVVEHHRSRIQRFFAIVKDEKSAWGKGNVD